MGIKFLCPNGHKLHVKAFLSGKKAICPKCGARVIVPEESSRSTAGDSGGPNGGSDSDSGDVFASDLSQADGASVILSTVSAAGLEAATAGRAATSQPTAGASGSRTSAIDEAPSAVWYVRPATGGQFGPASGEIMRNWINEGRVGASSLVWRAGWPEWRSASATFPELGPVLTPAVAIPGAKAVVTGGTLANGLPPLGATLPVAQVLQTLPGEASLAGSSAPIPAPGPIVPHARRKRRGNDLSVIASIVLILVSIILVIVLILVFRGQNEPADSPRQDSQTGTLDGGERQWLS